MFSGKLIAIAIAPAAASPMLSLSQVEAIAGKGLAGDRCSEGKGAFQKEQNGEVEDDQQVTLIEREAIEAAKREYNIELDLLASRRNLVTENTPLNHLVGREFRVGETVLRGIRLCEPCGHLEKSTQPGVRKALIHRGGLRAQIITGGILRVGDVIDALGRDEMANDKKMVDKKNERQRTRKVKN